MNQYEQMIVEIQLEATNFRTESQNLKENLAAIIAENNRLKLQHNQPDSIGAFRNNYIVVADKIFTNLRNQIHLVSQVCDILISFECNFHIKRYRKRKCMKTCGRKRLMCWREKFP